MIELVEFNLIFFNFFLLVVYVVIMLIFTAEDLN